jgi:hypothetical protein
MGLFVDHAKIVSFGAFVVISRLRTGTSQVHSSLESRLLRLCSLTFGFLFALVVGLWLGSKVHKLFLTRVSVLFGLGRRVSFTIELIKRSEFTFGKLSCFFRCKFGSGEIHRN